MAVIEKHKCPVCHHDAYLVSSEYQGQVLYNVLCTNPNCGLGTEPCNSADEARQSWQQKIEYFARIEAEKQAKSR